jgi:hypothetical protein
MRNFGIPQNQTFACILMVCPECGEKNPEPADRLRGKPTYYCNGDDCDYIFDLAPDRTGDFGKGFVQACKKFYAAMYAVGRPKLR